ncbi:MAG: PmoA family protein [Gemmataceae bacterium]|nr:PmoA family protein [Gemmataceae bacterium]
MRHLLAAVVIASGGMSPPLARAADVTAAKDGDAVVFKVGNEVVGQYHAGPGVAKPYLWPVTAPGGVPVTRAWPMDKTVAGETTDHVHQKSVWFCHGEVSAAGKKEVDFWSETKDKDGRPRHGTIRVTGVEVKPDGEVVTANEWLAPDGTKLLDETRTVRLVALPAGRLWVFDCVLKATAGEVVFDDTKEGSFGIRVHDALRPGAKGGGAVTTADGKTIPAPVKDDLPVWGRPADWIDYSGTVGGKPVGVAVFEHPENAARGGWHARAYGLLAANPFARGKSGFPSQKGKADPVTIPAGKELRLRYAVYAHAGDAAAGKVAEAYATFKR